MKTRTILPGALVLLLLLALTIHADDTGDFYYAIEQDGKVCGYAHVIVKPMDLDGRPGIHLVDSMLLHLTALGKPITGHYTFEYYIDAKTGMYTHHSSHIEQAETVMGCDADVMADRIRIIGQPDDDTSFVDLPEGVFLQNTRIHRHLVSFFVENDLPEVECQVFSEIDGTINDVRYTHLGDEVMKLNGKTYEAIKVDMLNTTIGIQVTMWVDSKTGLLLKTEHPIRSFYLTDSGVRNRVERADLDDHLFARVDTIITNPWAISSMKVRARLQPGGMWVTPEALNTPGQTFTGTVEDNRIDGIFEVAYDRYDGTNAPPFPHDYSQVDELRPYLEPAELIESDDPVLIAEAERLTKGATDSWDAATRLSAWVNEEIGYDLPGGVTARKTYDTRLGECGSHANLLTAFCRAVGIPARCVFGCMYVPDHGGAFGQHAWNEIYMGDSIGWIPVDCTADEVTYADCGHIRLGEWTSMASMLNPEEMELISFAVGEGTFADLDRGLSPEFYEPFLGKYQGPERVLTILKQGSGIGLDIPGKMVFELKDPDDDGHWFFKLTDKASVTFEQDADSAAVTSLTINSRQRLQRKQDEEPDLTDVPRKYHYVVGPYVIPMAGVTFEIVMKDDDLALQLGPEKVFALTFNEDAQQWETGDLGGSSIVLSFETDISGKATAMKFCELVHCTRME